MRSSISPSFHSFFASSLLLSPIRSSFLFPPRVLSSSYCWLDVFAHPPFAPVLIIASQQPLKCHPGKVPGTDLSSTRRYFEKGRENCYLSPFYSIFIPLPRDFLFEVEKEYKNDGSFKKLAMLSNV